MGLLSIRKRSSSSSNKRHVGRHPDSDVAAWKSGDPITEKLLKADKLPRPAKGSKLCYDSEVRGFAVCVTASGNRSFVLNYYVAGRERRIVIGRYPEINLAQARDEARDLRAGIRKGIDPLNKRQNDRDAPTMVDLAHDYFDLYADKIKRASSLRNDHAMLDNVILPKLGSLPVGGVTVRDLEGLHGSLRATPYQANRVLALLSKMFSLTIEWNWRTDNPAANISRFPEERRERWLDEGELARLTTALTKHPDQSAANAIRLLLLTGSRKGEVLGATWDQFNLERRVWTKPSSHTKQKKTEHIPLSEVAAKLLSEMKTSAKGEYLFPGRVPGTHREDLKNDWRDLCKAAKIEGARCHDLRHTFASVLVSDGIPLAVVGRLLGHTQVATTNRYAHLAESPLRAATERFGKLVSS